jgi:para-aminobenzoate synthetase component 1
MRATSNPSSVACCVEPVAYRAGELRFAALATRAGAVWLDSGNGSFSSGQYEILAAEPQRSAKIAQIDAQGNYTIVSEHLCGTDLFALLDAWQQAAVLPPGQPDLPFCGGVLGFIGYELNRSLERLTTPPPAAGPFPIAWIGYYGWALVQDIQARHAWLVADSPLSMATARQFLHTMDAGGDEADNFALTRPWQGSTSREQYLDSVATVQQLINAGDCYQVNLAQHFCATYRGHPWHAYRHLRQALPAPFSAFINTGDGCLLSHSPERFLHIAQGSITTSPIKGTRPRGTSAEQDAQLALELLNSSKDRAENLMIVDLLRNDLGRSCAPGSIKADALFALESFANVHHLVSTISGRLRAGTSPAQALRNAFPGGSITGAPKIRAMDIINQLEPVARSAYCGSVFYASNHGQMDSNIAIRSLVADGELIHCWGGGGIVADSDPLQEYAESLGKIAILLQELEK